MTTEQALNKDVIGLINCPINKRTLNKKEFGVTEYLAKKCNLNNNSEVMMIRNKIFSVSPITTHIDIKDVQKQIKKRNIINKVKTINNWHKKSVLWVSFRFIFIEFFLQSGHHCLLISDKLIPVLNPHTARWS